MRWQWNAVKLLNTDLRQCIIRWPYATSAFLKMPVNILDARRSSAAKGVCLPLLAQSFPNLCDQQTLFSLHAACSFSGTDFENVERECPVIERRKATRGSQGSGKTSLMDPGRLLMWLLEERCHRETSGWASRVGGTFWKVPETAAQTQCFYWSNDLAVWL